jgi:CheY-like chemotaxis protein
MNTPAATSPCWFVVDDESMILSLTEQVLRKFSNADVSACADPCEALNRMTATPAGIELLVTDLNMPGMSGIELARRVHALAPRAKVLLTTGSALPLPDEHALRAWGVDFFLPKPFGVHELMAAVRKLCGEESLRVA